jgi:hypothetical protein
VPAPSSARARRLLEPGSAPRVWTSPWRDPNIPARRWRVPFLRKAQRRRRSAGVLAGLRRPFPSGRTRCQVGTINRSERLSSFRWVPQDTVEIGELDLRSMKPHGRRARPHPGHLDLSALQSWHVPHRRGAAPTTTGRPVTRCRESSSRKLFEPRAPGRNLFATGPTGLARRRVEPDEPAPSSRRCARHPRDFS